MWIVGDMGGTNTRLAWADRDGLRPDSLRRFANDAYAGVDDILAQFCAGAPVPEAICLAVAGPVLGGQARLTNRDWTITPQAIASRTGAARVVVLNDLAALGHAAARLPASAAPQITAAGEAVSDGAQGLVIGIGTGLNACVFRRHAGGVTVLEAEAGHATIPASFLAVLEAALPAGCAPRPDAAPTYEGLLAGSGLVRLARLIASGQAAVDRHDWGRSGEGDGRAIIAAAEAGDAHAAAAVALFGTLTGMLAQELALMFMPRGGIWLGGSVAVGTLSCQIARGAFVEAFHRPVTAVPLLHRQFPVRLVVEDGAALEGCRQVLLEAGG